MWHPAEKLAQIDKLLSPLNKADFRIGAFVEDASSDDSHEKVIREIVPPLHKALDFLICEIDDDPDQLNAFGIYHPTDLAITLENLNNQGIQQLFISTHLHWPALEAEEKATLATAMQSFSSVVIAAPVRRNITTQAIPPSFLRSSIPASRIHGNAELLPIINNLSFDSDIQFPANTHAGFSSIESEKATSSIPLVARWDDRVIFSATLLALAQHSKVSPQDISVYPGKCIRIGNAANLIPINEFGHYQPDSTFSEKQPARTITSALSGESTIIGATQTFAILTATGIKSSQFEAIGQPFKKLSQLAFTPRVSSATALHRIPRWLECILLVDIALLSAWLLRYRGIRRHAYFLLSATIIWIAFSLLCRVAPYWSPLSIYLLPLAAGWLSAMVFSKFQLSTHQS